MKHNIKRKNFWILLLVDIFLLAFSYLFANFLRQDFNFSYLKLNEGYHFNFLLPILIIIKLIYNYNFDLYSGMWRFTSLKDLYNIIKACFISALTFIVIFFFIDKNILIPRSIPFIDFFLSVMVLSGSRIAVRIYYEYISKKINKHVKKKKVLIIGAGSSGEKLLREIKKNGNLRYKLVGFVDDDEKKIGTKIQGIKVYSLTKHIGFVAKKTEAEEAIIAFSKASEEQLKRTISFCKNANLEYKIVPPIEEIINKDFNLTLIRKVSYKDILGRSEVKLNLDEIENYLLDEVILVTGAGGSIGSELCKQIAKFKPKELLLLDMAESSLFEIDMDLKNNYENIKIIPIVGDIKDKNHLKLIFEKYAPQIVFHTAAYKHVFMMELQPWKAIENNVLGTKILLDVVKTFGLKKFIYISTDKAVNPTSIMGASKKIAELLLQNENDLNLSTVRFGNVLGSAGSVIPIFEKQIKKGGPVTVTDPEVKRFFMTIPEACLLVLQAGALSSGGEIFVLDMGKMKKIIDVAKEMIEFYGYEPNKDIKIKFIGLRKGEKRFEELYMQEESLCKTANKKISKVKIKDNRKISEENIKNFEEVVKKQNGEEIIKIIKDILPEYK